MSKQSQLALTALFAKQDRVERELLNRENDLLHGDSLWRALDDQHKALQAAIDFAVAEQLAEGTDD
jgi:hypothetical protein